MIVTVAIFAHTDGLQLFTPAKLDLIYFSVL